MQMQNPEDRRDLEVTLLNVLYAVAGFEENAKDQIEGLLASLVSQTTGETSNSSCPVAARSQDGHQSPLSTKIPSTLPRTY
jgi:hypothetical protein